MKFSEIINGKVCREVKQIRLRRNSLLEILVEAREIHTELLGACFFRMQLQNGQLDAAV